MINKKAMGMHWFILIMSFYISIGMIMYYQFIETDIPKVGEYSVIMGKTLEKGSIIPSLIEHVMEDINKRSIARFNDHTEFLDLLDSYCGGTYENNLGWSGFRIPYEGEGISALTSGEPIPEEEFGELTYCHMDTIRAKNKFRIIFTNNYNYFRDPRNTDFSEDFNLAGLQYDFNNPSEESGEFFIEITVRATNEGLRFSINKEDGSMLGSYRMRPNFKLPVDYDFNAFDDIREMCLFVKGCADFDDVVERYPGLYEVREEPCEYYDDCTEAGDIAKDDFGKYYETERFLCSGDCIPPPCGSDDESLTQRGLPTECQANSCSGYYSCFTTDCDCSAEAGNYACAGDCRPYCSSYDPTKISDGESSTNCRTDCSSFFDCNAPVSSLDCYCTPSTEQCEGSCVPYCTAIGAYCLDDCSNYHDCSSASCGCDTLNACAGACPSCWRGSWGPDGDCGVGCDGTEVLKTRTVMPSGCDDDSICSYRSRCDCAADTSDETKCMDNPCSSYVPDTCSSTLDCACLTANPCTGDCDVCTYGLWEDVGGCGEGICAADEVPVERESTNGCATEQDCHFRPIC